MATPEKPPLKQISCGSGYHCPFKDANIRECFKCSSCERVSRDPQITTCCNAQFCAHYLREVAGANKKCPECEEGFEFFPCKKIYQEILKFTVLCTMSEQGCDWEGVVRDLQEHEETCGYVYVPCPQKCGQQQIKRGSLEEHTRQNCPEREYACPHCNYKDTYKFVTNAHLAECSYKPIECPNKCGVTGERADMETHLQDACVLEFIQCRFKHAGCNMKFRREKEEQHLKEHSQQHLDTLASITEKMSEEIRALTAKNELQEQQKQHMKEQLDEFIADQQRQDEQRKRNEREIAELKLFVSRLDSLEDQVSNMTNNVNAQDDISPPEHPGDSERREIRELERRSKEKERELEKLHKKLEEYKTDSHKQNMQLHRRVEKLEKHCNNPPEGTAPGSCDQAMPHPQDGWITFTLRKYSKLKKGEEEWSSPAFQAFENGPQLQVIVWPNGQGEGKGTHVSVWLAQVKVDYHLPPYQVTLTLKLVGQAGIYPNPCTMTKDFVVPKPNRYVGHFSNKFIAHSDLSNIGVPTAYLVDDSLEFQIMCTGVCTQEIPRD